MSTSTGPANLEHRHLRSALQFAVDFADAGSRLKPSLPFPADLRPFLRQRRLPATSLGRIRRVIDANPEYRERLLGPATDDLVDPIGLEWLSRTEGWEDRVAALVDEAAMAAADEDAALALKRAERRRDAAEQAAVRARAEIAQLAGAVGVARAELAVKRGEASRLGDTVDTLRRELEAIRRDVRHGADREEAARSRSAALEDERDRALRRAADAERQRDELLAVRAELVGPSAPGGQLNELRALADAASTIASRLAALVTVTPVRRTPVALPGEVARDPRRAAEHLLRAPGAVAFVDGYNVAKLTWPDLTLLEQREHLLDAVDTVARRYGSELVVVFDGADVAGGHARRRRLARVRYSPGGVIADDVIRSEVGAADPTRPVIVVTNDLAVRRDVVAAGANVLASETFAALALS